MNREQRRAYDRKVKNDKLASICPNCGHRARMRTVARTSTDIDLVCERCGIVVCANSEAHKYVPAGLYMNQALYNMVIKAGIEKDTQNESNENQET